MILCPYSYRILGSPSEPRRLVDTVVAFTGYATVDPKAKCDREAYLSAYSYGDDFRARADGCGVVDVKGFSGHCWAPFVWFDIDRATDQGSALCDTRRLAAALVDHFEVDDENLLIFYSGSKGFHLGLPTTLWRPEPSVTFNRVTRRFAETAAEAAGVAIDTGVYDKVRAFRAPNSRHPKTGLHKRRFTLDELNGYTLDQILLAAQQPMSFDIPAPVKHSDRAAADWLAAVQQVERQAEAHIQRRVGSNGAARLNRQTHDFIQNGAVEGDRHRLLFSAAANLAEFGCPSKLAHALLTEVAQDSGLTPSDVRRQIECGLAAGGVGGTRND